MGIGQTISTNRREAVCLGASVAVHVLVLTWGVLTFAARPLPVHSEESMPIDKIGRAHV